MKKVVITGASKGIGKSVAMTLARKGDYDLAVCARNSDLLDDLRAKLQQANPNLNLLSFNCDVAEKSQVHDFAEKLNSEGFVPDVLINNAGIFRQGHLMEDESTLDELLQTNLWSAYYCTGALLPALRERPDSQIINMCSVAGIRAYENAGAYTISKHAFLGFSRSLREELKEENIKVSTILPGATYTPSWGDTTLPEERFIDPDDIGELVASMISMSNRTVIEEVLMRPFQGDI